MDYVLLTRGEVKDASLRKRLDEAGVPHQSVPLLEHAPGPSFAKLPERLGEAWDWVVVTSPTAARFLLKAWYETDRPDLRVAAIGKGTARTLAGGGLAVAYTSPQAYGSYLAADLGGGGRVLWPTSQLAGTALQETLSERGFVVVREDVYLTLPRRLSDAERALLDGAGVAALASPSAVRAWADASRARPPVAAIGRVSAQAALAAGFKHVWFPEKPGVEGWSQIIRDVFARLGTI